MKIRLSIVLAITLALCFALCGCASQQPESNEPDYQDAAFLADLAKGLEARWDLNNDFAAENPDGLETSESMKSYVQAEIDAVGDYANAEFEDPKLREYAVSYINILNECLDAAGSYSTNNIESLTRWTDLYNERTMLLKDIVSEYEVPISSEYQSNLSDIVANGNAAQKNRRGGICASGCCGYGSVRIRAGRVWVPAQRNRHGDEQYRHRFRRSDIRCSDV